MSVSIYVNPLGILITERLSGTWVTVSDEEDAMPNDNNICNEIREWNQHVVTVICNYQSRNAPIRGQYVTIRRKDDAIDRQYMNFCEVEVLSCPPGRWGYNHLNYAEGCSESCSGCNNTLETCRVLDGYCFTGCKGGFWGDSCDKQCNCLDGPTCNQTDGSCPFGKSHQGRFAFLVGWLSKVRVDWRFIEGR